MNFYKKTGITFLSILTVFGLSISLAHAFIGPSAGQNPGTGGGLFNVDSNRNIGFGTNSPSPSNLLEDTNTATAHGYIFTVASTTNPGLSLYNTTSGIRYLWSARNNGPLDLFRDNGTSGKVYLRFLSGGRLIVNPRGFGFPTSADDFLMVGGDITASSTITGGSFSGIGTNLTSLTGSNITAGAFGSGNYAFPSSLAVGTSTTVGLPSTLYVDGGIETEGVFHLKGTQSACDGNQAGVIRYNGDFSGCDGSSWSSFTSSGGGGGDGEWISTSTGIFYDAGNVGIGTQSPTSKLEVDGDIRFSDVSGGSPQVNSFYIGSSGVADDRIDFVNSANSNILFSILDDGDVGIGTTNPDAKTEIEGDLVSEELLRVSAAGSGGSDIGKAYIGFHHWGGQRTYPSARIGVEETDVADYDGSLVFQTRSSDADVAPSTRMTITESGNVGIGTENPSAKLDIRETNSYGIQGENSSGNRMWGIYHDETIDDRSAGLFMFDTSDNSTTVAIQGREGRSSYIDNGGPFGIGTSDPSSELDLEGADGNLAIRINNTQTSGWSGSEIFLSNSGSTKSRFSYTPNGGVSAGTYVGSISSDPLYLISNNSYGSPQVTVESGGSVGIGVTDPHNSYRLTIDGGGIYMKNNAVNYASQFHLNNAFKWDVYGSYGGFTNWLASQGTYGIYWPQVAWSPHIAAGNMGDYGSVSIYGGKSGWDGVSLDGNFNFMSDDSSTVGLYDDSENDWILLWEDNSYLRIYDPEGDGGYINFNSGGHLDMNSRNIFDVNKLSLDSGNTGNFGLSSGLNINASGGTGGIHLYNSVAPGIWIEEGDVTNQNSLVLTNAGRFIVQERNDDGSFVSAAFYYDYGGNDFVINGSLSKSSGSFDIKHPNPEKAEEGYRLKHYFVESPTAGDNLYRYTVETEDNEASIDLPDYFKHLNKNPQVWVSAVDVLGYGKGEVNQKLTKANIEVSKDGKYNILIIGTRKDEAATEYFNEDGIEYQLSEEELKKRKEDGISGD